MDGVYDYQKYLAGNTIITMKSSGQTIYSAPIKLEKDRDQTCFIYDRGSRPDIKYTLDPVENGTYFRIANFSQSNIDIILINADNEEIYSNNLESTGITETLEIEDVEHQLINDSLNPNRNNINTLIAISKNIEMISY